MIRAAAVAAAAVVGLAHGTAHAAGELNAGSDAFCMDGVDLETVKTRLHWAHVRNPALCSGGEIAEPAGEWSCDRVPVCGTDEAKKNPAPEPIRCVQPSDCRTEFRHCYRRYRCRPQSEDYNFDKLNRERHAAAEKSWEARTKSDAPAVDTCADLSQHLASCTAYRCERTHPVLPQQRLRFEVLGRDKSGCRVRETLAGGLLRTCTLAEQPPASAGDAVANGPGDDPFVRAVAGAECEVDLPGEPGQ